MFNVRNVKDRNADFFNTKAAETLTEAENKDFHAYNFKANNVTRILGYTGQTLSAITEALFIFKGTGGRLPLVQISNFLPVLSALAGIYIFEVIGVRVYLVRIIRQVTRKQLNTPAERVLLGFNILFCGVLLIANFYTSIVGQTSTFSDLKHTNNYSQYAAIDSALQADLEALTAAYTATEAAAKAELKSAKAALQSSYKRTAKDLAVSRYVAAKNGATATQNALNGQISEAATRLQESEAALQSSYESEAATRKTAYTEAVAAAKLKAENKKLALSTEAEGRVSILSMYQSYSLYFLLAFMALAVASIIYAEVYALGSKQSITITETPKRPNLLGVLIVGLWDKFYHMAYAFVVRIVGSKRYDYSKIVTSVEQVYSTDFARLDVAADAQNTRFDGYKRTGLQVVSDSAKQKPQSTDKADLTALYHNDKQIPHSNITTSQNAPKAADAAKAEALKKYSPSAVLMWYKRSDLVATSESKTDAAKARNAAKYLEAKAVLQRVGVSFTENTNSVKIKI